MSDPQEPQEPQGDPPTEEQKLFVEDLVEAPEELEEVELPDDWTEDAES